MKKTEVDPKKVIKTEPRMVKQPSPFMSGFFFGWMSLYLLMKLLGVV